MKDLIYTLAIGTTLKANGDMYDANKIIYMSYINRETAIQKGVELLRGLIMNDTSSDEFETEEDFYNYIECFINYFFKIIVTSPEKIEDTGENRQKMVDISDESTLYYNLLRVVDYEVQHYDYKGNLMRAYTVSDGVIEERCILDFQKHAGEKFNIGDIVTFDDGIYVVFDRPGNIFESKYPQYYNSIYYLEGVDKYGRYNYTSEHNTCREEELSIYKGKFDKGSFIYILLQMAKGKRPKWTPKESRLYLDNKNIRTGMEIIPDMSKPLYSKLRSFK